MARSGSTTLKRAAAKPRLAWLPGLVALLLVLFAARSGVLAPAEELLYAQTLRAFAPPPVSGEVALVELPSQWRAEQLGVLLEQLRGARAVAILSPLEGGENRNALEAISRRLAQLPEPELESEVESLAEPGATLRALRQQLDVDAILARKLAQAGNVVLAAPYRARMPGRTRIAIPSGALTSKSISLAHWLPGPAPAQLPQARQMQLPPQRLAEYAAGVGALEQPQLGNAFPLWLERDGQEVPGLLLELLRRHAGESLPAVKWTTGDTLRLGERSLVVDGDYRLRPYVDLQQGPVSVLPHYTLEGLLAVGLELQGMTVFVGEQSTVYPAALAFDAALRGELVAVPDWAPWVQLGALLLIAAVLMLVLPRMRTASASLLTLLLLLLLLNTEFLSLVLARQWLPLWLPSLVLLSGFPLVVLHARRGRREAGHERELSATHLQLGRVLQQQGELDQALEQYRQCLVDQTLLERLYQLGLDFERKRQFGRAAATFSLLHSASKGFRDVAERIERNRNMEQRVSLAGAGGVTPGGTVIMDSEGLQNPTLGHYEIEREIGRGAMGMVYLARDPRIGRPVAIKTMALACEFEGEQLEEVKQRFYREAETAGRLNHPNIVHVYDIGEEQELAYIAMDYLQGEQLGVHSKPERLLPLSEVLEIARQVAVALDYAHAQGVVHRDIKPANVIYDAEAGSAKITDFGVASLSDSSKTRTGTVLGSPSYMSPEQVAGKRVDGRSDIFSLGVTLFQLVTGQLPFEADSLGGLMYRIANDSHPKPGKLRKGLPVCVSRIINKCLQKEPQRRYQSGAELAAALTRCNK